MNTTKSMYKKRKKINIIAGMPLNKISDNRLRIVGYKIMEFTFTPDHALIAEREIKRVINA